MAGSCQLSECLLFPQKRTFADATVMSAKCHLRTHAPQQRQEAVADVGAAREIDRTVSPGVRGTSASRSTVQASRRSSKCLLKSNATADASLFLSSQPTRRDDPRPYVISFGQNGSGSSLGGIAAAGDLAEETERQRLAAGLVRARGRGPANPTLPKFHATVI